FYQTEILNKISVEVLKGEGKDGLLWNKYQIAEKAVDSDLYAWSAEYEVEYGRDTRGRISGLGLTSPVPTVRNVPVYPDSVLTPGDTWTEDGSEMFNLEPGFGIDEILSIRFVAHYRYDGNDDRDGKKLNKILISYSYIWNPDPELLGRLSIHSEYPVEISGDFSQEVWWDGNAGRNYAATGQFVYTYYMNTGDAFTFQGQSQGKAIYAEPMDKDALVKEIEELADDNISAASTELGVSVSLDDIHFIPDESVMLPGEIDKLKGIGEILLRYPDRDILIVGHTARVNSKSDGQLLSEERASAIARYFVENGIRNATRVITRGMGHRDPVGNNSTEEGRRKNRRVEIIILEN
ncbi:MAG: OmpA family protein, partial [Spirochaetaceae bacterium]|nr:OmpA family protein [Spirochaetaceae bacterium]